MKQEMTPVVSFVVPVYNVNPYLKRCVNSILQQTDQEYEIILIDDESTDGSGELCSQYAADNDKIVCHHQKNQGVSVARNQGISMARGKWICFVDGDDWVESGFVYEAKQLRDDLYDVVFFAYQNVNNGNKEKRINHYLHNVTLNENDFLCLQMGILNQGDTRLKKYEHIEGTPWAKMYSRRFLEENKLQFEPGVRKGQDGLFNMQVYGRAKRGIYRSHILYNYRINAGSVCRRYNSDICQYSHHLIRKFRKQLRDLDNQQLFDLFDYFIVRQLMYCILLDFCHKENKMGYRVRRNCYLHEKKKFAMFIKRLKMSNMKWKEKIMLILIRYFPFWCVDCAVKMLK